MDPIIKNALRNDGPFIISSGQEVDQYLDMYRVLLDPVWLTDLKRRLLLRFFNASLNFVFVAGRETAGALLASTLANELKLKSLVIRSKVRDHGTCESIEKPVGYQHLLKEGLNSVLLVDDVSSTGVSMLDSITKLRSEGFNPVLAYSVVYRGLGADKIAEKEGVLFEYLFYHTENTSD